MLHFRLETDAIFLILQKVHVGIRRQEILALLEKFDSNYTTNSSSLRKRANELFNTGFGLGDSAHLAYAESTSDIFITYDDKLLKKSKKENILIPTINPIEFVIKEELQ